MFGCKAASFLFCNCLNLILVFDATTCDSGELGHEQNSYCCLKNTWTETSLSLVLAVCDMNPHSRTEVRNQTWNLHQAWTKMIKSRFNYNPRRTRLKAISGAFTLCQLSKRLRMHLLVSSYIVASLIRSKNLDIDNGDDWRDELGRRQEVVGGR